MRQVVWIFVLCSMVAHQCVALTSMRNYVARGTGTKADKDYWTGTLCSKGSYFYGCTASAAAAYQWIDVRRWASLIDQGNRKYYASASLGGFDTQGDYALVTLYFSTSTGNVGNKGTASTPAVKLADRGSVTKLLSRSVSGNIPSGTRWIRYTIRMFRSAGSNNDGYSDNHVFQIDSSDQPAGFNIVGGEYGDALGLQAWSGTLCTKGSHYYGCKAATATATQTLYLTNYASRISAGLVTYAMSASLGGYLTQSDKAAFYAKFYNSAGSLRATTTLGPVTVSNRGSVTTLLSRSASGTVHTQTTRITFQITATRQSSHGNTYNNDGYSDNLRFTMTKLAAPCPAGSYGPSGKDPCTQCACGTYAASTGSSSCTTCAEGTYSSAGASACTVCPTGKYSASAGSCSCTNCAAGAFTGSAGSTSCSSCPCGTFAPIGAAACSNCAANTFSVVQSGSCQSCAIGTSSLEGSCGCSEPTPNPDHCSDSCLFGRCTAGQSFTVTVVGGFSANVWGNGHYTDDSNVGAAALHAGVVGLGETKAVTVHCTGPQDNFTATEKNGVQSQAFGSWVSSMSFEGDASFTPNPVSTLPPQPENCFDPLCVHNKCAVQGSSFEIVVTGAASASPAVYGTSTFTDDSNVLSAVVHAGVLLAGQTGTVKVKCTGPRTTYTGSEENGVVSQSYGDWPYSFEVELVRAHAEPPADICTTCLDSKCGTAGTSFRVSVLGTTTAKIWGTSAYSDDSHVGVAAVHAGIVQVGETREIVATCQGPQQSFTGSLQNSVQSKDFAFPWPGSYSLVPSGTNPEASPCVGACVHNKCTVIGSRRHITVTGATFGTAWGVDKYTDDSNVQLAAVHMGLVEVGATATLVLTCSGPADTWPSSTRHGVTTTPYNQHWRFSFTLALP